jgi:4'-phosphopantetheinyl transferase EntD
MRLVRLVPLDDMPEGDGRRVSGDHVRRGLPSPVGVGIRYFDDIQGVPLLHPVEASALGPRVVEQRRLSFAVGRLAARDALAELGIGDVGIARAPSGEPLWPQGVVGAISHSNEVALALVGWRSDYVGLGIDVEELGRGPTPRAARLVCRPAEMEWAAPEAGTERLAMLFSAKEAVFKALYPIEGVWLGFADAELSWRGEIGAFEARVLKSVGAGFPEGFLVGVNVTLGATWVLSVACVPAGANPQA